MIVNDFSLQPDCTLFGFDRLLKFKPFTTFSNLLHIIQTDMAVRQFKKFKLLLVHSTRFGDLVVKNLLDLHVLVHNRFVIVY